MKKLLKKGVALFTALTMAAALTAPALGAELKGTTLNVHQGINLYVNCTSYRAADVNGNETKPFLYNGTTYVPLRAMSAMLGSNLVWDQESKTINISSLYNIDPVNDTIGRQDTQLTATTITAYEGVEIYLSGQRFVPTDVNGQEVAVYLVDGTTYVPVRALASLYNVAISYDSETARVYIGIQPGQIEAEGDKSLTYPFLSKERNDRLQLYKDCIELMEPVVGLMWTWQDQYLALKAQADLYVEAVRQFILANKLSDPAAEAALSGVVAAQASVAELNTYLNMMATRFTDCKAYIENIPFDAKEEELDDKLLFETCGQMLDTCWQERGRMESISKPETLSTLQSNLDAAYTSARGVLGF